MKYIYYDGAGNKYEIKSDGLSYSPMKPAESSSGTYDGGEAYTKALTKLDFIKFVDVFERAIWNKEAHSERREMGCGTIRKYLDSEVVSKLYLKMNSSPSEEIIDLINALE